MRCHLLAQVAYPQALHRWENQEARVLGQHVCVPAAVEDVDNNTRTNTSKQARAHLRSNTPMLSRPRNPPSNKFLPLESLRLTHQVKLSISLWNTRSKNMKSATPWALRIHVCVQTTSIQHSVGRAIKVWATDLRVSLKTRMAAHACTGGLTSSKFHSYLPRRGHPKLYNRSATCFSAEAAAVHATPKQGTRTQESVRTGVDTTHAA